MAFSLSLPGGLFDIPDSVWTAGNEVIEDHLVSLNSLIRYAAVADEYLAGAPQRNGGKVALPQSGDDGYTYARSECLYAFAVQTSQNPDTASQSGNGNLLFFTDFIAQDTGKVSAIVNYYVQGAQETATTDGLVAVLVVARRGAGQKTPVVTGTGGGSSGGGGGVPTGGGNNGSDDDQGDQGDGKHQGSRPRMTN